MYSIGIPVTNRTNDRPVRTRGSEREMSRFNPTLI
jgi:hypothetical protein